MRRERMPSFYTITGSSNDAAFDILGRFTSRSVHNLCCNPGWTQSHLTTSNIFLWPIMRELIRCHKPASQMFLMFR